MKTPKVGDRVRLIGCNHFRTDVYHTELFKNRERGRNKYGTVVWAENTMFRPFISVETDDHERWGCHYTGSEYLVLDPPCGKCGKEAAIAAFLGEMLCQDCLDLERNLNER